jgi:hypothetical protein
MIIITGIDPHTRVDLDGHTHMVTEVVLDIIPDLAPVTILEVVRDIVLDLVPVTIPEVVRDIVREAVRITILDITQEMVGINLN